MAAKVCAVCVVNRDVFVCGSHNVAINGDLPEILAVFLRLTEVEERYMLGNLVVISSHEMLLLS